jgi:hypothetical protein
VFTSAATECGCRAVLEIHTSAPNTGNGTNTLSFLVHGTFSLEVKQSECEAGHLPPSTSGVKNGGTTRIPSLLHMSSWRAICSLSTTTILCYVDEGCQAGRSYVFGYIKVRVKCSAYTLTVDQAIDAEKIYALLKMKRNVSNCSSTFSAPDVIFIWLWLYL